MNESEVCNLLNNLDSYPAIKTTMDANLYFNYLIIKHPGQEFKHSDDFRHLVDASYCTILVSNDIKLKKYAAEIIPNLEVIEFDNIVKLNYLGDNYHFEIR